MLGAIEAGGTKTVIAVARNRHEILNSVVIPTTTPEDTLSIVGDFFDAAILQFAEPLSGIGIASFGPVDISPASPCYGTIGKTPKPGWSGASYLSVLKRFNAPVKLDTDVNGAGLAEWLDGAGQNCETLAYITVGTGIGAGVLSNGRSVSGFSHTELGHILIPAHVEDRFAGCCPFHLNCLEGLASGKAIQNRWGKALSAYSSSDLPVVMEAHYLAHLAMTLILSHAPDRLIFGGGVMKAEGLIEAVREKTQSLLSGYVEHERLDPGLETYIVSPRLGDRAGIIGALALAETAAN